MQRNSRQETLALFLVVFWILLVLGGYYYYHKPITPEMLAGPLSALLDLGFAVAFAGLAGALGRRLWKAEVLPMLEQAGLHFAIGSALISLTWLVLGALGLYRFPLAAPLLLLGLALFWRDALKWLGAFRAIPDSWRAVGLLEKGLAGLCAVLILYQLLIALAPPFKWDALAYHLQLPRQYLAAGRLVFTPENPYWGHPQIVEMLYTFAMSFHRPETAAVLGWAAGVIFLAGLFGLTRSQLARMNPANSVHHAESAGWMAVTAVLAGLTFRNLLAFAYTDLFSALFGLVALIGFFAWLERGETGWFWLAGLACGLAAGTKWTAGVLALGLFLAVLLFWKRTPFATQRGRGVLNYVVGGLVALAAVLPWLIKNAIATGNPLYPYLMATPWVNAARLASANQPPESVQLWQHLLLPFSTTWAGVDSAPGFSTDLGPLLLLFALPGYCIYRRCLNVQVLAVLLLPAALVIGLAGLRYEHLLQTRLYFALLPCLALPCGWGWEWLQRQVFQRVRLRRILAAVVWLVMGLAVWQDTRTQAEITPGRVILGAESREAYQETTLGYYSLAMQMLEKLPPGARVIFLWEPRGLYAPLSVQADLWIDRWRTDRRELNSAGAILESWRQQGFTHILVYQNGVELIKPKEGQPPSADWIAWQETLAQLSQPQTLNPFYQVYSLK